MKRMLVTLLVMLSATIITGCTMQYTKTAEIDKSANIIIFPPRDAIQAGRLHPAGVGTGSQLQRDVKRKLDNYGFQNVYVFEETPVMNHKAEIPRADAIAVARELKVKYCLLMDLGEFRNAAPLTFRSDFMTLQSGHLIDVDTGLDVWTLTEPLEKSKNNFGNNYALLDKISTLVAKSIAKQLHD